MIVTQFLFWYFLEVPKKILEGWKNFLKFNIEYFSIPVLFRTFFSHWRRYRWIYPRGFDFSAYIEIFFSNLISRALGMFMRIILISIGLLGQIFITLAGILALTIWVLLPIFFIIGLFFSLKMIF